MKKCMMVEHEPETSETEEDRWGAHLRQLETALREFRNSKQSQVKDNITDDCLFPIEVAQWRVEWCKLPCQYRLNLHGITEGLPVIFETDETEEMENPVFDKKIETEAMQVDMNDENFVYNFTTEASPKPRFQLRPIKTGSELDFIQNENINKIDHNGTERAPADHGKAATKNPSYDNLHGRVSSRNLTHQIIVKSAGAEDPEHKKTFWTKLRNKLHKGHENTS